MSNLTITPGTGFPVPRPRAECRVFERHSCELPAICQPPTVWGDKDLHWAATIRDLSVSGIRLVLRRRFEPGAGLAIELPATDSCPASTVLARVVHARSQGDGSWALGCKFVSPLSDEELATLLRAAEPTAPAAPEEPALPVAGSVVANVLLRGTLPDGRVVKRLIRQLQLSSAWPAPAAKVFDLRVGTSDAPPVRLRVDGCQRRGDVWVLRCAFVGPIPADVF